MYRVARVVRVSNEVVMLRVSMIEKLSEIESKDYEVVWTCWAYERGTEDYRSARGGCGGKVRLRYWSACIKSRRGTS